MVGKHRAPGQDTMNGGRTCQRCGAMPSGQFCEACGFSLTPPAGSVPPVAHDTSGAPESLLPPVPRPETVPASQGWFEPSPASRDRLATVPEPPPAPRTQTEPPGLPAALATWTVVVSCDRVYYDRMRAAGGMPSSVASFPARAAGRWIPLVGQQMRIGRRTANRDFEPEIDLADPPADRGVSRLHAVLVAAPDGTWSLHDSGSANGTLLNGREVVTGATVPLRQGDRINLGAWTVITVYRG
jgi:FHA domain